MRTQQKFKKVYTQQCLTQQKYSTEIQTTIVLNRNLKKTVLNRALTTKVLNRNLNNKCTQKKFKQQSIQKKFKQQMYSTEVLTTVVF